eukprot:5974028-Pleurochrysis_carterae.AAC.1
MVFDSIFTSSAEKSQKATRPSPSAFSTLKLDRSSPDAPRVGDTSTVHRYGRGATRQRGACFEALSQRQ